MMVIVGIIASLIGFFIALYIYRKQHAHKPLMCPRKAPCEAVLNSPQATTYGFSNAGLGIVFYVIAFFFLIMLWMGGSSSIVEILLLLLTATGFAFSVYLVRIQRDVIKQWCAWCLASAAMATILFIASIIILF